MNALRHGGYATATPVIPGGPLAEDPDVYARFRAAVITSWQPVGPVEEELAASIATLLWRARRPSAYEATYLATTSGTPFDLPLAQALHLLPWYRSAARALRDPTGRHPTGDLEAAAIASGFHTGLEMEDGWPHPKPATPEAWNELIDTTLANGDSDRERATRYCDDTAADWKVRADRLLVDHRTAAVTEVIDLELLTRTASAEAHIGRELSRNIALLRTLQSDRQPQGD